MAKRKALVAITRNDRRTGDEYIRQWCESVGSIIAAGRKAHLFRTHLHVWLDDPDRSFSPVTALKVSRAAKVPVEAVLYRFVPIKDLGMWKFMK